jgi:hypothetical protein
MSISYGAELTSANLNAAFPSKTVDNTLVGVQHVTNTTQSTDKDTGSVILEGGIGVEKNINAGGTVLGSNLSGSNSGDVTISTAAGLSLAGQALSMATASTSVQGTLTNTDWNTFNNKEPAITTLAATKGGTGNNTYASGDMLYSQYSNALAKLTIGSTGQVLTVAAGVPSWATPTAGGGGGGGANWLPVEGSGPISETNSLIGEKAFVFTSGLLESISLSYKVPKSFAVGTSQLFLDIDFFSPATSNYIKFQSTATLIRNGVDLVSSTTNQRTASLDLIQSTGNRLQHLQLDLTSTTSTINGVTVSGNDLIKIELKRVNSATTESTSDAYIIPSTTEIGI